MDKSRHEYIGHPIRHLLEIILNYQYLVFVAANSPTFGPTYGYRLLCPPRLHRLPGRSLRFVHALSLPEPPSVDRAPQALPPRTRPNAAVLESVRSGAADQRGVGCGRISLFVHGRSDKSEVISNEQQRLSVIRCPVHRGRSGSSNSGGFPLRPQKTCAI
jgi:hypothetical protein